MDNLQPYSSFNGKNMEHEYLPTMRVLVFKEITLPNFPFPMVQYYKTEDGKSLIPDKLVGPTAHKKIMARFNQGA